VRDPLRTHASEEAKERAPLQAGLRIRGFQLQLHCVSLVRPFCGGLGAARRRCRAAFKQVPALDAGGA
jgi:hypothetical protein